MSTALSESGPGGGSSTRAVERALALLATVCTSDLTTLAEASRRTSVPASTALRLLRTLEREHFVAQDDDAAWHPGPRLLQLAVRSLARDSLARLAQPTLGRLSRSSGESAYLSVRGVEGRAVHVAAAEGTRPVRYAEWVGHTVPLEGTAVGQALAGQTGPGGYAVVTGPPGEPDVTQVSAPVHRPGGIAAALSLVGPAYRLDGPTAARLGEQLVAEATALHSALGSIDDLPEQTPSTTTTKAVRR